ncbi:MAG: SLBB domain-containing protein [Bacteroidota bacterium]
MNRIFAVLILLFVSVGIAVAQNLPISEAQAREELRKRGLTEDQVRKKLEEKGIDIDNLSPAELPRLESALEEAVRELEAEQQGTQGASPSAPTIDANPAELKEKLESDIRDVRKEELEDIQDAVQEGKPLDQAIAEELVDNKQEKLPQSTIYGQQLFRDKRISVFSQSQDINPADSYILGPGDRVNVSIWGESQEDVNFEINKAGYIKPSEMPRINLKGITFGQAKALLRRRFGQYYRFRPEEFELTITFARTITISIYGEVFNPGGFTLPATNTAFNALVAAGGPSDIGSVRNIRLIRANETQTIDVYEFMNDPTVREKYYLQDNDIIHVGIARRTVRINGSVRRPFLYELKEQENLRKLIEYAGGLRDNAYRSIIRIKRFENDAERIIDVEWAKLQEQNGDFPLEAGDQVVVSAIPTPYKNFVEVTGAVEIAKRFELTNGMRIRDLVEKGILQEGARRDIAYLLRTNPDGRVSYERIDLQKVLSAPSDVANLSLLPKDRLLILSQQAYADKATITVAGAVRNPSDYPFDANGVVRISDLVILAGGLRPEATSFAYITRTNLENPEKKEFIRINIQDAVSNPSSADNQVLRPFDVVRVYATTTYTDEFSIRVSGAVRLPGDYRWEESLKLKDVLTMAGGLRLEAASSRIDISRLVITDNEPTKTIVATVEVDDAMNLISNETTLQLEPFDQIYVRRVPEFELQQNVQIDGEVKFPGPYPLLDNNEKLSSIIARAGGLTSEAFLEGATLLRKEEGIGFIIMDLEEALSNTSSRYNFILKEGDVIDIPKRKDLVSISITNTKAADLYPDKLTGSGQLNVAYHSGKNARFYVNKYAAGLGEKGRGSLISVEHPNGEIKRTKNFGLFKIYPKVRKGSVVKVGQKKPKAKKEKDAPGSREGEGVDWGQTISDTLAQVTAVLSLILLIQQVNR